MKKELLLLTALISGSLSFSQTTGTYETDTNGKLFFQSFNEAPPHQSGNPLGPMDLSLDWSNPDFNISNNPTEDSWDVRLAVGNTGNAYVVYNDNHSNGLQKIMFRKKVVGQEWTDAIFVDKGGEIGGRNNHFPAIAASPNGDLHVIYNVWAMENVRNYIGYSHYDAANDIWSDGLKISDLGGTVNHFNSRHDIYSTADNLPVVIWGFDFRENQVNEEIYMKYFDGNDWSADIAVSDVTDGFDAGFPNIKSIGSNKALILYSENTGSGAMELRYKIYDEVTHQLSPSKTITTENIFYNNYVLATTGTGEVMILTINKKTGPDRDVLNIYDYDIAGDAFTLSDNTFEVVANAGGLLKRIDMDCNSGSDCAVIFNDFLAQTNSFLEYSTAGGFGTPFVINEENPGFDAPSARFDPNGNLHVVWTDYRFDDGQGFDEREVFYEMGENVNMGTNEFFSSAIAVFPNPSKGNFTIETSGSHKLQIYDASGRLIDSKMISGTTHINKTLSPGTYFLHFKNEKETQVKKIIVK
ncbi:T9SS type A sorting domain-containing protein [Moheibacter sediminis]|uniref:Por secretion system C-terminal sorting domain-containing protein n=1 Tax=Moheibacter sediminis TaxID=1434700 RepID=A0A1W1YAM8_9FLAO|nr:T9SS type A sorting domain-containing protein [Moheibacter sediminis]SMC32798.1 Por secretion system C-terminal sorting domain-containing protein [Moheibacter sediminis]